MFSVYLCLGFLFLLFFIYCWSQRRMKRKEQVLNVGNLEYVKITNQDEDVWNISARVNQQNQGSNPQSNWPTHDAHISVDSFVLTPEYTVKDTRPPPPPYSEVDLPSYEQATGCRLPKPDLPIVHPGGSSHRNNPGPSS